MLEIHYETLDHVPIEKIKPYNNVICASAKKLCAVAELINDYGFEQPILCDTNGIICRGHTLYYAAIKAGLTSVPVTYVHNISELSAYVLRVSDFLLVGKNQHFQQLKLTLANLFNQDNTLPSLGKLRTRNGWSCETKHCALEKNVSIRKKCDYLCISLYKVGKEGISLEEFKRDDMHVSICCKELCDILLTQFGNNLSQGNWCICTTPRRRHSVGFHFSTAVCEAASEYLKIPFYADVVIAENRSRLEPKFILQKHPLESNIILFDDILTTGITMQETRRLFIQEKYTVFPIVAIWNG